MVAWVRAAVTSCSTLAWFLSLLSHYPLVVVVVAVDVVVVVVVLCVFVCVCVCVLAGNFHSRAPRSVILARVIDCSGHRVSRLRPSLASSPKIS